MGYHAAFFTPLGELPGGGDGSNAHGVSGDGSVIVGDSVSSNGHEPFRWTATSGMVGLGGMPGGGGGNAVSADGKVVVGNSPSATLSTLAFRWTEEGGMVDLGFLPGGSGESAALAVSGDGTYIVGHADIVSPGPATAFIWDEVNGMVSLGGGFSSLAYDISYDGSVVVGSFPSGTGGFNEAFRWTEQGGMVGLSDLPGGDVRSHAFSVSADGSVVVGYSVSANGDEAFRWTESGGMVGLGGLPSDTFQSVAYAVSGDGYEVVGHSGAQAFVWTPNDGMLNLQDILTNDYGLDLTGWQLDYAQDISDDGTTIVGRGINPDGHEEAWTVRLLLDRPPVDPILPGTGHHYEDHSDHDHTHYGHAARHMRWWLVLATQIANNI
jgi:probable HAF family extracellular repeat protein